MIFREISPLRYRWSFPAKTFFFLFYLAALLAPIPYVFFQPGTPDDVGGKLISIKDAKTYPVNGKLFITSILVTNPDAPVFGPETLYNWAVGSSVVIPREIVYPKSESKNQSVQQSQSEMTSSQASATAAALNYLGYQFTTAYYINAIRPYSNARGKLEPNDYVVAIDGKKITKLEDVRTSYIGKKIGDHLQITVERKNSAGQFSQLTYDVTLVANQDKNSSGLQSGKPAIGILVGTTGKFPIDIQFNIDDVGGPSAGMIFALGIVDKLTEEDLVRGRKIAGTGTISAQGSVGAIGGIEEKMIGAKRAGATIFLAPRENCPDIRHVPRGLKVIPVSTLRESIATLRLPDNSKFPTC